MLPLPSTSRLGLVLVLVLFGGLCVAGCGLVSTTPPPEGPADFGGITGRLAPRGVTIAEVVSGDAGCDDQDLARTAIRFRASAGGRGDPVLVYLYIFRNRDAFERNLSRVEDCARTYVQPGVAPTLLEVSPYVLVTPDPIDSELAGDLRAALVEAAGTGG